VQINPEGMDVGKILVEIEDFFPMEYKEVEHRNSYLLFGS